VLEAGIAVVGAGVTGVAVATAGSLGVSVEDDFQNCHDRPAHPVSTRASDPTISSVDPIRLRILEFLLRDGFGGSAR
jgi:hypothetical protein